MGDVDESMIDMIPPSQELPLGTRDPPGSLCLRFARVLHLYGNIGEADGDKERELKLRPGRSKVSRQCLFSPSPHLPTRPMTRSAYLSIAFTLSTLSFAL